MKKIAGYTSSSRVLNKHQMLEGLKLGNKPKQTAEVERVLKLREEALKEREQVEKGLLPPNKAFHLKIIQQQEIYVKTLPLLKIFDNMLSELQEATSLQFYPNDLAKFVKILKIETDNKLDKDLYANESLENQYRDINKEMERLDLNIQKVHFTKFKELNQLLESWIDNNDFDVDSVNKKSVDDQYLTLNQISIDTSVKNKLKVFSTKQIDVLDIPMIQLGILITREKLEKTKGFGDKSIEVLSKVFEELCIKW